MSKLVALVIGHHKKMKGARNKDLGVWEFDFNSKLAKRIQQKVTQGEVELVWRDTYRELPWKINRIGPDFIISLHCNAFNGKVSGSEVLYYHTSTKGKKIAQILLKEIVNALELKSRGIKGRRKGGRGGYLLYYTYAPCVIGEPFFIDNNEDLLCAQKKFEKLVSAYARTIDKVITEGIV